MERSTPMLERIMAATDRIVESLLSGYSSIEHLDPDLYDELERRGDIEAWEQLESEARPVVDWADPDQHDLETISWYDQSADPYWRGPESPDDCLFILGTHRPNWLYPGRREARPAGPLFISARQLRERRKSAYPVSDTPFMVDSGGFTELRKFGGWKTTALEYALQVEALARETGSLQWAAIQDWMVEDDALAATGLTVEEHQRRTLASYLELRELSPETRWLPVLQGRTLAEYEAHLGMYAAAGVHLELMELVGVGSVCRRQSDSDIAELLAGLAGRGLRLHGFGVKLGGLRLAAEWLASSDSLAWSYGAVRRSPGKQNSIVTAEAYREQVAEIAEVRT